MKNEYLIEEDVAKIYFRKTPGFFVVDKEDFEKISQYTWYLNQNGYPSTTKEGKHQTCHRIIMGKSSKEIVVDHIDRNRLNNKRSNLRFVTIRDNNLNRSNLFRELDPNSDVGIRERIGKRGNTYRVEIHDSNNKTIGIGSYKNKETAIKVRNIAYKLRDDGELTPYQINKLRTSIAKK